MKWIPFFLIPVALCMASQAFSAPRILTAIDHGWVVSGSLSNAGKLVQLKRGDESYGYTSQDERLEQILKDLGELWASRQTYILPRLKKGEDAASFPHVGGSSQKSFLEAWIENGNSFQLERCKNVYCCMLYDKGELFYEGVAGSIEAAIRKILTVWDDSPESSIKNSILPEPGIL